MTDLVVRTVPGDQLARPWTVHASWRAHRSLPASETSESHPDWPTARRDALGLACLAGVRYVTVQNPEGVVVGDWDRYTNRWREYHHPNPGESQP